MPEGRSILLADDGRSLRGRVSAELAAAGFELVPVHGGAAAWETLQRRPVDLVVAELQAPHTDGLALLRRIRAGRAPGPHLPVILVAKRASLPAALRAGRLGASDLLPLSDEGIARLVERSLDLVAADCSGLPDALVGTSPAVRALRSRLDALAELEVPVLLHGAAHAGHDAAASYLHARSARASEALRRHEGGRSAEALALDASGTLHVAPAEELSGAEQQALRAELRHAEETPREGRARLVVSAGEEPAGAAESGRLDRELLEHLERFRVRLPRLRERRQDLPPLVERFLQRSAARLGRSLASVDDAALARLARHPWPHDLRDLARVVELLAAFAPRGHVTPEVADAALAELDGPLDRIAREHERRERELLLELYAKHGTYTGVARELGLTRNAAKYRFAKHGLAASTQRPSE